MAKIGCKVIEKGCIYFFLKRYIMLIDSILAMIKFEVLP